jgi:hypothetical protein
VSVATPLLTQDAMALLRALRPAWQRWLIASAIPLAVLAVIVVHTLAAPAPACTDQAPCGPAPLDYLALGLLLAAACAGPFDAMAAGWLSTAFLAVLVPAERIVASAMVSPLWTYVVDAALVALCFAMARVSRWRAASEALTWSAATPHERIPAGAVALAARVATAGHRRRWLGMALLAAAVLFSGAVLWQQARGEERQEAARRTSGVVVGHADDGLSIQVRLDGADVDATLPVLSVDGHPAGQRLGVYVDEAGIVALVSEPYDVTPWLTLTVMLVGAGWAVWRRGSRAAADRQAFLAAAQPVTSVYVRFGDEVAAVYAADARSGDEPVAVLHGPVRRPGFEDGLAPPIMEIAPWREATAVRPTMPGLLYGTPAPGAWCLAEVDGEFAVPRRSVEEGDDAPGFTTPMRDEPW